MTTPALRVGQAFSLGGPEVLDTARIVSFAAISGDDSPAHLSDEEAAQVGFPRALAHGMLGMAFLARLLTQIVAERALRRMSGRFLAMTFHGDQLICTATVTRLDEGAGAADLALSVVNQHGQPVFAGEATIELGGLLDAAAATF